MARKQSSPNTTFVAHVVIQTADKPTKKQVRAYVQDALDKYDGGWFGHDLEPVSAKVRRDVDIQ